MNKKTTLSKEQRKLIIFPIKITEEELRKKRNRKLFLFPFEVENSEETSDDDRDEYESRDSVIIPEKDELFLFPIHPDEKQQNEKTSIIKKNLICYPIYKSSSVNDLIY